MRFKVDLIWLEENPFPINCLPNATLLANIYVRKSKCHVFNGEHILMQSDKSKKGCYGQCNPVAEFVEWRERDRKM